MKNITLSILIIILFGIILGNIAAQNNIPQLINYQGFLTDANGKALNGEDFKIVFSFYNRAEGGDPLWQETHDPVSVANGMFNVLLGAVDSTLQTSLFTGKIYVGIKIGDEAEVTPRMELASVPYSLRADHSVNADSAAHAMKANKAFALDAPDGDPENAVFVDNDGNAEITGRVKDMTGFILPVGSVLPFAGDTSFVDGWLVCDGSAISRTEYADLFAVIGITYGGGDGVATFNLPNLTGRIPVGFDGGQGIFDAVGKKGGANSHKLSVSEMPSHNHANGSYDRLLRHTGTGTTPGQDSSPNEPNILSSGTIQPSGGNQAHNNLQPYIVMNYIIKY